MLAVFAVNALGSPNSTLLTQLFPDPRILLQLGPLHSHVLLLFPRLFPAVFSVGYPGLVSCVMRCSTSPISLRTTGTSTYSTINQYFIYSTPFHPKVQISCLSVCQLLVIIHHFVFSGIGIYHSGSLVNHSCRPNCVAVFDGTELTIHVTEEIQPKEELTISYTELMLPSVKRKEELKRQYFFDCHCVRCSCADEEDGMLMSMKCSKPGCDGMVSGSLMSQIMLGNEPPIPTYGKDHQVVTAMAIVLCSILFIYLIN